LGILNIMKKYIFLIVFLFLLLPSFVLADIYRWTDSDGTLHITDDLNKVPLEHRKKITTMETEPAVRGVRARGVKAGSVTGKNEVRPKDAEMEIYGDHPLAWWLLTFKKLRREVDTAKNELENKKQFIEVFRRGRRLGQHNKPEDIETFNKYKADIPLIKKRLRTSERKLEDLNRRARLSGVPKNVRR